jgi:hypothetical protein
MGAEDRATQIRPLNPDAAPAPLGPLTERVLARLGRPRWLSIVVWGLLTFAAYEVSFRVYHAPVYPGRLVAVSSAYVNLLALWAIARVTAELEAIRPLVQRLNGGTADTGFWPFQAAGSVAGPLVMGVMMTLIWNVVDFIRYPGPVTAILIPVMFLAWLPAETALWFFGAVLVGLYRLGRQSLHLIPFEEDRSMGLRPLGAVAFTSFVVLTAAVLPLLATQWGDVRGAITNLLFFLGFVALFFASLHGLHRQMVKAKASVLAQAHRLYVEAFQPIRAQWSLQSVAEQSARLTAAEAIERRATAIQEWPLDEGLLARLAAIITSVVGVILARLILSRFGL